MTYIFQTKHLIFEHDSSIYFFLQELLIILVVLAICNLTYYLKKHLIEVFTQDIILLTISIKLFKSIFFIVFISIY